MVLGTAQPMAEDLAPWVSASCSQGTFWTVCVSPGGEQPWQGPRQLRLLRGHSRGR